MRLTRTSDGTDSSVTEWRRREPDWSAGANDTSCSRVSRLLSPGPLLCFSTRSSPCLVLLPVGFALPVLSPEPRCALTAPFHPYREAPCEAARRFVFCGTVPVLADGGCYPPPCPVEPGLSSIRVNRTAIAWPALDEACAVYGSRSLGRSGSRQSSARTRSNPSENAAIAQSDQSSAG